MPKAPLMICRAPGCKARVRGGGLCKEHKRKAEAMQRKRRGTTAERGYGAKWQRFSKWYRREHPVCCNDLGVHPGIVKPTEVVDHFVPHRNDPALMYDLDNLRPRCKPCHDFKTGTMDTPHGTEGEGASKDGQPRSYDRCHVCAQKTAIIGSGV